MNKKCTHTYTYLERDKETERHDIYIIKKTDKNTKHK